MHSAVHCALEVQETAPPDFLFVWSWYTCSCKHSAPDSNAGKIVYEELIGYGIEGSGKVMRRESWP